MAKLVPRPPKNFVTCHFQYNEILQTDLRALPGCHWSQAWRCWLVPDDATSYIPAIGEKHGVSLRLGAVKSAYVVTRSERQLFDFQHEVSVRARTAGYVLSNLETGLGKTAASIDAVADAGTVLILCPPGVISVWRDEILKWDGSATAADIDTIASRDAFTTLVEPAAKYTIVPYARLTAEASPKRFDALIADESHYLKNPKAIRTQAVLNLRANNLNAMFIAQTATPIANTPIDLWQQLDLLRPKAYGSHYSFKARHCYGKANEHARSGYSFNGLNLLYEAELRERLALVAVRKTKAEVAGLLPAFCVQAIKQRPDVSIRADLAALTRQFAKANAKQHDQVSEKAFLLARSDKVAMASEQVDLAFDEGQTHVCVLAYNIETAKALYKHLEASCYIDGSVPAAERDKRLMHAKNSRKAIVVCTMKSLLEGKDLTWCTTAIYAELYYSPLVMVQSLGRFSRLNSKLPSKALLLCLEGTLDESVCYSVLEKIADTNRIFKAGATEKQLEAVLADTDDEEAFFARMRAVASSRTESEDCY